MSLTITPSPFGSLVVSVAETGSTLSVTTVATSPSVLSMALGVPGPQGEQGEPGANGQGVAVGGTTGQALVKLSGTDYDTGWATISGGGGTWGSITGTLSDQTDLYDALNGKLSLTGGTLTGPITFSTDETNDSQVGAWGFGVENTSGSVATVEPSIIHIYDTVNTNGISIAPSQITFPDGSTQATAYNPSVLNGYLPLTGGTLTGNIQLAGFTYYDGSNDSNLVLGDGLIYSFSDNSQVLTIVPNTIYFNSGMNLSSSSITFPDSTIQTTAFPPTGGTTTQYIDGTGALQTFPTVTTAGKMVTSVRNNSGATITKGTVVYINGALGNKPTIAKAQANSESTSKATFAFVQTDILNNTEGDVVQLGLLENIDTQGFTDGQQIFLSPTTAGGWTSTQPFSPYHYVRLGTVIRGGHPTQGSISVNIINGFQLDELSDVGSTSPSNNNVLTWNSATSQWLDKSISTILGYTPLSSTTASSTYLTISSASSTYQTQSGMSAYLSTSAASSTYQTQSGMSAYLSTSAASSTYQTQAGMSAYLSTSAASTTYIAQTQYATTSQAQAGLSTSAVISASTLQDAKYFAGGKSIVQITWSTAVSGTGASASAQNANARLNAGPTSATGYAIATAVIANNSRGAIFNSGFDFSKRVSFGVRVARNVTSPDTNSVFRYSIGKSSVTDASDLSARGLMIKVAGTGALQLLVHNGTTLTTTTSSYTPTNGVGYDVLVVSDGSGNVTLYVNGSSVATSTGGPTSAGSTNANVLMFEIQNTATLSASPQNICISDYFVQVNT